MRLHVSWRHKPTRFLSLHKPEIRTTNPVLVAFSAQLEEQTSCASAPCGQKMSCRRPLHTVAALTDDLALYTLPDRKSESTPQRQLHCGVQLCSVTPETAIKTLDILREMFPKPTGHSHTEAVLKHHLPKCPPGPHPEIFEREPEVFFPVHRNGFWNL